MIDVQVERDWLDVLTLVVTILVAIGTVASAAIAVRVAGADARDRRNHQATQVSAWIDWTTNSAPPDGEPSGPLQPQVVISNGSSSSIYEVVITWGAVQGAGQPYGMPAGGVPVCVPKVPPGRWRCPAPLYGGGGMHLVTDAAISFTDSAGRFWRRDAPGTLTQTSKSPLSDLEVVRPLSYARLEPLLNQ